MEFYEPVVGVTHYISSGSIICGSRCSGEGDGACNYLDAINPITCKKCLLKIYPNGELFGPSGRVVRPVGRQAKRARRF